MQNKFSRNSVTYFGSRPGDEDVDTEVGEGQIIRLSRGEVRPRLHNDICGICGRTLLKGETAELYLEPNGVKPVVVCPVCRAYVRESGYSKAS